MIDYNTSEGFELTPEGTHNAVITGTEIYNNPKGNDKIIVKFAFEHPETGATVKHNEFVMPQIMQGDGFRVFADLIGLVGDHDKEGTFDEESLIGLDCIITVKHREYNDKIYANIIQINAPKKKEA